MAHPDGNMGFNPELESSLNNDTQGRIEASLPEVPDPKPFVKAEFTPGMKMGELAARVVTQADVQRGILVSAAQQQFEADKQVPVDPGPEFGTRQADRDNKAFEDLKAAKEKIEADAAKAVKFAKVLETSEADLTNAETTYAAAVDQAVADRNKDFLEVARTAKGNSKEAAIQSKFVEDIHQANTEHAQVVEDVAKAAKLLGIHENTTDDATLDTAVEQKTNSLKQSLELSQRVHGQGDASAVHYQEEIDAIQNAAQLLKKEREEHLIDQSSIRRGKAVDQALNQRLDALVELSQDTSRKGTRLAKARENFEANLTQSSNEYHQTTFKIDEALSNLGLEETHRDVLKAAKNRETSSVETGGAVTPPTPDAQSIQVTLSRIENIITGITQLDSLTPEELDKLRSAYDNLPKDVREEFDRKANDHEWDTLFLQEPQSYFRPDFWDTPHTLDSLTPKDRVMINRLVANNQLTPQMRASLGMPPVTPELTLPTPPATELDPLVAAVMQGRRDLSTLTEEEKAAYQNAVNNLTDEQSAWLTTALKHQKERELEEADAAAIIAAAPLSSETSGNPDLELPLPPITLPEENPDIAATAPTEPVLPPVPENVGVDEKKRGFSKSNFITKFASHLLPIPSQENGATDGWDGLAWLVGAAAVTASNLTGFPFSNTIGKFAVNASVLVLNYGGKWTLNSVGRADDTEVKAGRMTSEQAAQRRLERIKKHNRFTRITKNVAKGAAAAAIVFGVVNLSELALSGVQAAAGAAPDILSGATNVGESISQFGQHAVESVSQLGHNVVESASQLGSNAVEAVRQTGESISNYVADVIHHLVPDLDLPGGGGEVLHKATEKVGSVANEMIKGLSGVIESKPGMGFWNSDLSKIGEIAPWADQAGGPSHEDMVRAIIRGIWNSQHPGEVLQPFNPDLPLDQQAGFLDLSSLSETQQSALDTLLKTTSRADYLANTNGVRDLFNQFVAVTK